MDLKEDIVKM